MVVLRSGHDPGVRLLAVVPVIGLGVAVGCSDDDGPDGVAGPTLVTQPAGPANGEDAQIRGFLRYDPKRDCVYLGPPGVAFRDRLDERTLPVWPHGYTAEGEAGEVRIYDEDGNLVAKEGDAITAGGGYHEAPTGAVICGVPRSTDSAAVMREPRRLG